MTYVDKNGKALQDAVKLYSKEGELGGLQVSLNGLISQTLMRLV